MVKMIQNLRGKMEAHSYLLEVQITEMQKMFNKDLEELKNKQSAINSIIAEIKNTLERTNSRLFEAEEQIRDRMVEMTEAEQNKEKGIKRNEDSLRDLWYNNKHTHTRIIWVKEEENKKEYEKIFEEIIVENFTNMVKKITTQIKESQRVPYKINPRRNIPRHINLTKIRHKEQILKVARGKQQVTYKGIPIRLTADLSTETLQARRKRQDILKLMKGEKKKTLQTRLLYPARTSFRFKGKIKSSTNKS